MDFSQYDTKKKREKLDKNKEEFSWLFRTYFRMQCADMNLFLSHKWRSISETKVIPHKISREYSLGIKQQKKGSGACTDFWETQWGKRALKDTYLWTG